MTTFVRFSVNKEIYFGILQNNFIKAIKGDIFGTWEPTDNRYFLNEVKLLAPLNPGKIVGVGLNYHSNVVALKAATPTEPVIFLKPPSAVIGTGENIIYPPDVVELAYEVELAVVIKDQTKNVSPQEAMSHVFGYTCANDLTAKDKMTGGPWTLAKSYDTFQPLGPWIVTGLDSDNLGMEMYLNGKQTQCSNTSDMIFDVSYLISYVSKIMTLNAGDVLITGTPPGSGILQHGDSIEGRIQGIGLLMNTVVRGEE